MYLPIGKCPSCQSSMVKMTDQEGRVWFMCPTCGVQIPVSEYREVKSGTRESKSNS